MARQRTKPKRKRDATWFRDKVLLVEAQGFSKVLNEEELEFLADLGVVEGPVTQTDITHNAAYQADDLDAYDSNYDDFSTAKVVLMANLSSYSLDVLSEVSHSENTHNDMLNQSVQEMPYSEQTHLVNYPENEITTRLQAKDPTIKKLKENIKRLNKTSTTNSVKKDTDEIETINIELEHRGMYKIDPVTLAPKDKNNRETYIYYLKHTMEQAAILREMDEQAKSLNPLDSAYYSACTYVKLIQDLLGYVRDTCPDIYKPSEKLVDVKPNNKKKIVRFVEPVILSSTSQKQLGSSQTKTKQTTNNSGSTSTGVSRSTKSSRSKSTDNTKNDRILQISSRTQKKNKVDDHSRIINKPKIAKSVISNKTEPDTSRGSNTLVAPSSSSSVDLRDMMASSLICLLSKASKTKSWLWHRRLSHLNFGAINHLAKNGLVRGLPKLKFEKDHLCSACAMGKSKKQSHKPKSEDTNQEKLYLLHMDLCGPMRVASINGKKYILVIMDDYSQFTWVKFLASKDEAPDFIIKFLKMIQVRLNTPVRNIRTDNGTEFVNQTLRSYYESVGISHETSVARSPQQNGVVERRNRTLVEAARTMLIYAKAPLFLWAEAVATACYTQNRSIIRRRHGKTPYELLHDRKPDLSYLHVFGALCYPNNDSEDLGKLQAKADIGIFIGYAPKKKAYRIYNRLPVAAAPRTVDLADSPVSLSIDEDTPSTSIPSSQDQEHSPIISQGFKESPKTPHFHDDPLHESLHEDLTSQGSSSNVRPIHTPFESLGRWTKDHPIANVIGDPSCSFSTRKQL
ncbi:retrovirus-related pol polyprotein from transposon TNT 1-94 [Tanacetum coccineum]